MGRRHVAVLCFAVVLAGSPVLGQDLSGYRGVHLGDSTRSVIGATGALSTELKLVHERPALMQDLEWRPQDLAGSISADDPVNRVLFSFYRDQLYRILVTYQHNRIEGLTDDDLVDSLSSAYGMPVTSAAAKVLRPLETPDLGEQYRVVARWENAEHSIVLVRGVDLVPLSLVMLAKHAATDARHADLESP
jgi:hypothetical protein